MLTTESIQFSCAALPVPRNQLAESPFWHTSQQRLFWCDIKGRTVHAYEPKRKRHEQWAFDSEVGCIAAVEGNFVVVALRASVELLNTLTGQRKKLIDIPHDAKLLRSNDGKCDAKGRFWIGTVFEPKTAEDAALWRFQASETGYVIEKILSENVTANGLAFSLDNTKMYWAHTVQHRIDELDFDVATGLPSNRQVWARFTDKAATLSSQTYGGRPDGAAMDVEACYWSAMYEGGCLVRLSPQGEVMQRIKVPTLYPTMVCFGGDSFRTLYVTSANPSSPAQASASQDGLIFCADVNVQGLATPYFKPLKSDVV